MTSKKQTPREFDLYFVIDDDGLIYPYSSSVCEHSEKWTPNSKWPEPTIHAIEYSAYKAAQDEAEKYKTLAEELKKTLELINQEELNGQRPGGYYSKSATLSYEALLDYDSKIKDNKK